MAIAGHQGDEHLVRTGLISPDPPVRAAALGAAARLELLDPDTLESAIGDESLTVRRRAIELIGHRPDLAGGPDGDRATIVAALLGALADEACAEVAAFALGELGSTTAEVVTALQHQGSEHGDPLCREAAVAALGSLGVGRDTVLAALSDIATVRRRAVVALAAFEGPDVDAALRGALDDRDWQVRQAAEDLLSPEERR